MLDADWKDWKVQSAENAVHMYANFVKNARWHWWDQAFLYFFVIAAIIEFTFGIYDVVTNASIFDIVISFSVGAAQILMFVLNTRMKALRLERQANWRQKHADALAELRSLDSDNSLLPVVIEEEP